MHKSLAIFAIAVFAASAASAQTAPAAAPAPSAAGKLADKLINQPLTATWNVFGTTQTNEVMPTGGPQNYPTTRVTVSAKGANPWDAGAVSQLSKSVAGGDVLLVAVYLRAPLLKVGETTPITYLGLSEGPPNYPVVLSASVNITNQWKVYYASGKVTKAYAVGDITAGVHLAADKHVVDLGPIRVFDLGPDVDSARLPKND